MGPRFRYLHQKRFIALVPQVTAAALLFGLQLWGRPFWLRLPAALREGEVCIVVAVLSQLVVDWGGARRYEGLRLRLVRLLQHVGRRAENWSLGLRLLIISCFNRWLLCRLFNDSNLYYDLPRILNNSLPF